MTNTWRQQTTHQGFLAEFYRDSAPTGETVVRLRVKEQTPIDEMEARGSIDDRQYDAAKQFRRDFERCPFCPKYARINTDRVTGGLREVSDKQQAALQRINRALLAVGREAGSILWFVAGAGESIAQWCRRTGKSPHYARGLLQAGLDGLATHYHI